MVKAALLRSVSSVLLSVFGQRSVSVTIPVRTHADFNGRAHERRCIWACTWKKLDGNKTASRSRPARAKEGF